MSKFTSRILLVFALVFALILPSFGQFGLPKGLADKSYGPKALGRTSDWQLFCDNLLNQRSASNSASIATSTNYDNYRIKHTNRTGKVIRQIILGYSNGYKGGGTVENVIANDMTVYAAIEKRGTDDNDQSSTGRRPVRFGGALGKLIPTGAKPSIVWSDPVDVFIAPGESFFERVAVAVPANGNVYPTALCTRGGTSTYGIDNGEGASTATTNKIYDGGGSITVQALNKRFGACIMLGLTADGSWTPTPAILGDSLAAGTDDAQQGIGYGGYLERALAAYPTIRQPSGGETAQQGQTDTGTYFLTSVTGYATHVFWEYGTNDLGSTVALMKQYTLAAAYRAACNGQIFTATTLLPKTTSSDGFRTAANQTATVNESKRTQYNDWIIDTSASGFVAQAKAQCVSAGFTAPSVFALDVCSAVEVNTSNVLTRNGGIIIQPTTLDVVTGTLTSATSSTAVDSGKSWTTNQWKTLGYSMRITGGTGSGQCQGILYNTGTTCGFTSLWTTNPDATSTYSIGGYITVDGTHLTSIGHKMVSDAIASQIARIMATTS